MNIYFKGVDEVQGMINKYTSGFTAKLSKGVAEGGMTIRDAARAKAPVDTGHLRRSIHTQTRGLKCEVGTNVHYGIYQEFGTYKMNPRPYLMPALLENQENIKAIIKASISGG